MHKDARNIIIMVLPILTAAIVEMIKDEK